MDLKPVTFILLIFTVVFTSCQPKVQELKIRKDQFSDQSGNWKVNLDFPVFSSSDQEVNKGCEILNQQIRQFMTGRQDSLKAEADELFQSFKTDSMPRPNWIYTLDVTDSVFMATSEYISVRFEVYTFTGGAHGITDFYAFNYDVKNRELLEPEEIVAYKDSDAVSRSLQAHFKNPENCFTTEPTLDLVSVINFTPGDVCFTFTQYTLGAYYCGIAEITVPKTELTKSVLLRNAKQKR